MTRLFFLIFNTWLLLAATAVQGHTATLTPQALLSGTYRIDLFKDSRWVTLQNGAFTQRQPDDFLMVRLNKDALGDLNGDGINDAAVVLATNTGGSGVFIILATVLNDGGKPRQVA